MSESISDTREIPIAPIEPLAVDVVGAAALIGISRAMFYKLDERGLIGPRGVKLGKCKRWPIAELRAWVAAGMPPRAEWQARDCG